MVGRTAAPEAEGTVSSVLKNTIWLIVVRTSFLLALLSLNRFHDEEHANLLNAMWLIAITFLSVGFGDIVPNTYCGRGIAVSTGIMVSCCVHLLLLLLHTIRWWVVR